jgi:hypothetical protein
MLLVIAVVTAATALFLCLVCTCYLKIARMFSTSYDDDLVKSLRVPEFNSFASTNVDAAWERYVRDQQRRASRHLHVDVELRGMPSLTAMDLDAEDKPPEYDDVVAVHVQVPTGAENHRPPPSYQSLNPAQLLKFQA